jgi:hypothetical protein
LAATGALPAGLGQGRELLPLPPLTPAGDMTEDMATQYKVRVCKTIEEALCLGGRNWQWTPCCPSASTAATP